LKYLLKIVIFYGYVKLPEGTPKVYSFTSWFPCRRLLAVPHVPTGHRLQRGARHLPGGAKLALGIGTSGRDGAAETGG
jgi:hypothetical protein